MEDDFAKKGLLQHKLRIGKICFEKYVTFVNNIYQSVCNLIFLKRKLQQLALLITSESLSLLQLKCILYPLWSFIVCLFVFEMIILLMQ